VPKAWRRTLSVGVLIAGVAGLATPTAADSRRPVGPDVLVCRDRYQTSSTDSTFTNPVATNRLVLGRIWLPKASVVLGWPKTPNATGKERFLKHGIVVTIGPPVTLTIPSSAKRIYAFSFDSAHAAATVAASRTALIIRPCAPIHSLTNATAWPGGYLATRPACVPLVVAANGRSTRVRLALGRPC
jgi:hypothetical protein